jgi:hypothetical protein
MRAPHFPWLWLVALAASFSIGGAAQEPSLLPAGRPSVAQVTKTLEELAASPDVESRKEASVYLAVHLSAPEQIQVLWKLFEDSDPGVREEALLTLAIVSPERHFSHDNAVKFASYLQDRLKKYKLCSAPGEPVPDDDLRMVCLQAKALTALYRHHNLISVWSYRREWQYEALVSLSISSVFRSREDSKYDSVFLYLFSEVDEPEAALRVLPVITETLPRIGGMRALNLLMNLSKHPLLGEGRALRLHLAISAAPLVNSIRTRIENEPATPTDRQIAKGNLLSLENNLRAEIARNQPRL